MGNRWTKEASQDTLDTVIFNSVVDKTRTKKKFSNVYSRQKSHTSQKAFFFVLQIIEHKMEKCICRWYLTTVHLSPSKVAYMYHSV